MAVENALKMGTGGENTLREASCHGPSWSTWCGRRMRKRADVADYFAHLSDEQPPYLEKLRELSRAAAPDLVETLHWNNPGCWSIA
jgi:hypothetical protein